MSDSHGHRAADGRPVSLSSMHRVCVTMFIGGGLTCLSGVWTTQSTPEAQVAQGVLAATFIATGLLLWVLPPRRRVLEGSVFWSIVLLSALVARSNPIGMAPSFYLWPVVYMAYFSTRRVLVATYGWMGLTLALGLAANPTHELKVDTFTGTMVAVGLMAALVAMMTTQQAQLRDELAVAAETDALTGLLNRRSFDPRLALLVEDAVARNRPLSVVMFDLDDFKRLNDELGHLAGDRALEAVAAVLRRESRDDDLVSRFGGEEFAVALSGADAPAAGRYTERVAAALRGLTAEVGLPLATSAGICTLTSAQEPAATLLLCADRALYAAKAAGRCRAAHWGASIEVGPPFGEPASL